MGVGVRVGKGVEVGMGVGVTWRGGTSVAARLSPMLMTTRRLMVQNMIRVRRDFERRTVPPVSGCCLAFHYSTAVGRHKRGELNILYMLVLKCVTSIWASHYLARCAGRAYLKTVVTLLTMPTFRCIMTISQLMTVS